MASTRYTWPVFFFPCLWQTFLIDQSLISTEPSATFSKHFTPTKFFLSTFQYSPLFLCSSAIPLGFSQSNFGINSPLSLPLCNHSAMLPYLLTLIWSLELQLKNSLQCPILFINVRSYYLLTLKSLFLDGTIPIQSS